MIEPRDRLRRAVPPSVRTQVKRRVLDPLRHRRPLVPEDELRASYADSLRLLGGDTEPSALGDYVEFGVCHGTSMACMAEATHALGADSVRLIGFDSFEGLPAGVEQDDGGVWYEGEFRSSERAARRLLERRGVEPARYELVKGWFDDTATPVTAARLGLTRVSIAMIDCDVYSSARTALRFLGPLLADRCVLYFDDWHSAGLGEQGEGERRAFEEWLSTGPGLEVVDELPPYADNAEVRLLART